MEVGQFVPHQLQVPLYATQQRFLWSHLEIIFLVGHEQFYTKCAKLYQPALQSVAT